MKLARAWESRDGALAQAVLIPAQPNRRTARFANMPEAKQQSTFDRIGILVSSFVADIAASPIAQIAVIVICASWFVAGFANALLTTILSILAITLTQMVLNQQQAREGEAHRRDVAMHAKLDELLVALRGARNEMAGIEELDEETIEEMKVDAQQAIDEAGEAAGEPDQRTVAKGAVDAAAKTVSRRVAKPKAKAKAKAAAKT